MKIAGITIDSLDNVALLTSAKENGYPSKLMVSIIRNGELASQTVMIHEDYMSNEVCRICTTYHTLKWKTTLKKHKNAFISLFLKNHITLK